MSEFAGIVTFERSGAARERLAPMVSSLDGAGAEPVRIHCTETGAFAFRQRIVAHEDRFENQPSVGSESAIVSMFDGRLDNRAELLDALGLASRANEPVPDGTIARAAFERWGEAAPARLLGDFAWAVWDERAGKLVLARDHSVCRALFYCKTDRFIAFATAYAPLLALPGVSNAPDKITMARLLAAAPTTDSRTLYKSICWVGSASRVTLMRDGLGESRFWEPDCREPLRLRSDDDYIEAARSVFDKAVADRLRLDGPICSAISGGLDSSAVAATAARLSGGEKVRAFCMVPRADTTARDTAGRYANEAPLVAQIAARYDNLDVDFVDQGYDDTHAVGLVPMLGMPLRAPGSFLWFGQMRKRAAALGLTTMLHGGFGNYTLSAAGEYEADLLRREGDYLGLGRMLLTPGERTRTARHIVRASLPHRPSPNLRSALALAPFNPDFVREHDIDATFQQDSIVRLNRAGGEPRARTLRFVTMRARIQMESTAAQRRLYGITAVDPFSDRRVIDFSLSLPADQFNRSGETRRLARRAFADRLPEAVINNQRRGLQDPEWHWRIMAQRERNDATLDRFARSALVSEVLDVARIRSELHAIPSDAHAAAGYAEKARALERALQVGAFLAWTETGMAKVDSLAAS